MSEQTAMKLWKESGSPEYVFWAAIAMNAQVDGVGPSPALNLAEMMMKRPLDAVRGPPLSCLHCLARVCPLPCLQGSVRHSEAVGLLFHTMIRQGKVGPAHKPAHGAPASPAHLPRARMCSAACGATVQAEEALAAFRGPYHHVTSAAEEAARAAEDDAVPAEREQEHYSKKVQ